MEIDASVGSLVIVYLIVAAIQLTGCFKEHKTLIFISKPLLMPLLIAVYILSVKQSFSWLIVTALCFDTVGDILLMLRDTKGMKYLIAGMGAFMIGHICYISWFFTIADSFSIQPVWILGVIGTIFLIVWFWKTMLRSGHRFAVLLALYSIFIGAMIIGALYSWKSGPLFGTLSCVAGTLLFCLSDFFIAMETIGKRIGDRGSVMLTYMLAQFLLVIGFIVLT